MARRTPAEGTPSTLSSTHSAQSGQSRLSNTVALITGAGRGIGRAVAERFAREGARLVLCSRTRKELDLVVSTIRSSGGEAVGRVADISSASDARGLVRLAIQRYGTLDVVINNAGILGPRVPIIEYPKREWEKVLLINLTGTFYISQEAARVMVPRRRGCLIMMASSVGRQGRAEWGAYAVSKFGVEGFVQVMAEELRPHGICVMSFNPGGTRTQMRAEAYPGEDPSTPRDPVIPAEALVHLASTCSLQWSGQAFDLSHLPAPAPAPRAVSLTRRKSK